MVSIEEVKQALPSTLRTNVSQDLVDKLNNINKDPHTAEVIRDNFISYTSVMKDGKFKIDDYINAVTYVSFKLMGNSNLDSYCKTFPDRYAAMKAAGKSDKDISSFVSNYNKNKLVNLIFEQTLIPAWVYNQDMFQKALNVQLEIATTGTSEMARTQAANSLLTHLAKPKEAANFQLNINTEDSSGMKELKDSLLALSQAQIQSIKSGTSTKEIADSGLIIDGEISE